MNVVDYVLNTDTTTAAINNYDEKKQNEQIYFQLCKSCFGALLVFTCHRKKKTNISQNVHIVMKLD